MRQTRLTILALAALLLASCQGPTTPVAPPTDTTTVGEVLTENGFTTLATAITAAGLNETLAGTGPFTIFAPTDAAFEALEPGLLDSLLANPAALAEVLKYHVLPEEVSAAALTPGFRTSLQGSPIAVTTTGEGDTAAPYLNALAIVGETDLEADNGVVHAIDAVLQLPKTAFAAALSGANQVPPVDSDASGSLTATLEGTTLTISGTYEGLSVVETPGAHIHGPADTDQNADVLFPLTFDNAAGTLAATVDLAAAENAAFGPAAFGYLQDGRLYANLHTEENPEGEIRGQLVPADQVILEPDFTAVLNGGEQVPPVETDGEGTAQAALDDANTTLTVTGTYTGLSGAPTPPPGDSSAAHIHVAPIGENGPIVAPLTLTPGTDPTEGTFAAEIPVGTAAGQLVLETLQADGYYINIHTEENLTGEIRGQLSTVPTDEPDPAP